MSTDPGAGEGQGASSVYDAALLRLSRLTLAGGRRPEDVLSEAGATITATLGVSRVGIWFFREDVQIIRCEYLYQHGRVQSCEGTILHASDFPTYFDAITASRAVPVTARAGDAIAQEFRDAYLTPLRITAMLDVPIYRSGRIVGIVCHEHTGPPRQWTEDECHFASSVGDIAGRLCEEAVRRSAQEAAARSQKQIEALAHVSAMGRMAAGLAHDFNNVLTSVLGYADLIRETAPDCPGIAELLHELHASAQVGCRFVERLRSFALADGGHPRVTDPAPIVEGLRSMLAAAVGNGPSLRIDIAKGLGRVFIDPVDLERILLNLVVNARDATPDGGRISVTLSAAPLPNDAGLGSPYVVLEVRDTGHGIDPSLHQRVLEPFFTTKGEQGTGLGLAIVNRAATRAGGFVEIASPPGEGARVRVYLPRIAASESKPMEA